ncbi:MAG: YihY/virulence factor BrkB family protein [Deltaproteobacteria bacterium]|nr:YihY/virulence factor BrkB family protein [Deltaproteobacteria bacterium]
MKKRLAILWDGVKLFDKNSCFTSAAAISFYAFFSLIPLMILITASLGFILGTRTGMLDRVIGMVQKSIPYLGDLVLDDLTDLARRWRKFGWVGLLSLISSAELVLGAMSDALSAVFDTTNRFNWFRRKILNLLGLLLVILTAFVSIAITAASLLFKKLHFKVFGFDLTYFIFDSFAFKYILPFLLVTLIVALGYKIISGPNMNFEYAFYGSILFTALWELAKNLFAWYVSNFPSYNKFYGSLGTIMILMIWIFYSANIFLFSASVAKAAYDRNVMPAKA